MKSEAEKPKMKYISLGGIYKVQCVSSNSVYIGQSTNIDNRLNNHRSTLRTGKHAVYLMQSDFKKYGESAFVFEAIHHSDEQNLLELETFYIDEHKRQGHIIYNSVKITDSVSMVQCSKENRPVLQKISDMLDNGQIKREELESAIFYKTSF